MASSMIHYIVSHLIADRIGIKNLNLFLIGAVLAPDTGNKEDGSYCKLHFMETCNDTSKKGLNWNTFSGMHLEEMDKDYYLGYFCHIIMDALWYHDVYDKYIRHLPNDIKNEKIQAMYRDYWRLNHLLIKKYNIPRDHISAVDIPDVSIDRGSLLSMADRFGKQLQAPECDTDELEVLTWDIVVDYIDKAKKLCMQEVSAVVNGRSGRNPLDLFVSTIS